MAYLIFDTETNGLPVDWNAPTSDTFCWPRLVQLSWILCDHISFPLKQSTVIVKPDNFNIPSHVSSLHGITNQRALAEGLPLRRVLEDFDKARRMASTLVAHNIKFDVNVIEAEFYRVGLFCNLNSMKQVCTMKDSAKFCKIPGKGKYPGSFKWPRLDELYFKLFQQEYERKHDAREDMLACAKCFFELKRLGVL